MSKKLFVGGLAWATTTETLNKTFAVFGDITEAKVITDRDTGRSRGFGFVNFVDDQAADDAIKALDGQSLDGRTIHVNVSEDKPGRPRAPRRNYNHDRA